jgi:dTDP-4-amino-4,6-dideoxygalactose transaminase
LQTAIRIAHRRVGGIVGLPAFQCYDLVSAAVGADVQVALYDIDPATLAPDPDSLRRLVAAGARVVVIAPLYGIPVPWDTLAKEVESAGGVAIEDAAQGHGASWRDRPVGSWGNLAVLSFGRGKGWCGGSGGALLLRNGWENEEVTDPRAPGGGLAAEARVVMQLKAQWLFGRPALYGVPAAIPGLHLGETIYHPPRNPVGITKAAAAAVRAHATPSQNEAGMRRDNARRLLREAGLWGGGIATPAGGAAGFLRLPLRLKREHETDDVPVGLGVARSYPTTLGVLPALKGHFAGAGALPGAESLARGLVTAPTHSRVTAADRRALVEWMRRAIEGRV